MLTNCETKQASERVDTLVQVLERTSSMRTISAPVCANMRPPTYKGSLLVPANERIKREFVVEDSETARRTVSDAQVARVDVRISELGDFALRGRSRSANNHRRSSSTRLQHFAIGLASFCSIGRTFVFSAGAIRTCQFVHARVSCESRAVMLEPCR